MKDDDVRDAIARKYCINGADLTLPTSRPSWLTDQFDRIIESCRDRKVFLQLPSFHGATAIGVFSDYSGSHREATVQAYSFLMVDMGALGTFDVAVKESRARAGLAPAREIAFTELRSASVALALPEVLRAADRLPGLLFTVVIDKRIRSVLSPEPRAYKSMREQLDALGFKSWKSGDDAERLLRILHSVCYWLSMLGRDGLKVFWMTDNDSILGRSTHADEFKNAYLRALQLFDPPEFALLGLAKSFSVGDQQPSLHEAVSIADLVAGGMTAYFTERGGREVNKRRRPDIVEIMSFLGHQSPFLKKATFTIMLSSSGSVECGLASFHPSALAPGYTAVKF